MSEKLRRASQKIKSARRLTVGDLGPANADFEDNGPGQGFSKKLILVHAVPQLIKFNAKQMGKVTQIKENVQAVMAIVVPTMQFVAVISSIAEQKLIAQWLLYLIGLVILLPYYATFADYRRHRICERRYYYFLLAHNVVMDLLNRKLWQNKAFNFGLFYCLFISIATFSGPIPWGTYLTVVGASAVYLKVAVDLSNAEAQLVSFNKVLEEVTYKEISVMNYINEQWLYTFLHHKETHRKEVVAKCTEQWKERHSILSKRMTQQEYHDGGYYMKMEEFQAFYNAHEHLKPEANLNFIQVPRCFFITPGEELSDVVVKDDPAKEEPAKEEPAKEQAQQVAVMQAFAVKGDKAKKEDAADKQKDEEDAEEDAEEVKEEEVVPVEEEKAPEPEPEPEPEPVKEETEAIQPFVPEEIPTGPEAEAEAEVDAEDANTKAEEPSNPDEATM